MSGSKARSPGHRPNIDMSTGTTDGRLRLGSLTFKRGAETPEAGGDARFPLALISRKQHLKFLNSNYGGFDAHLPAEREPLLQIHPVDAASRGLLSGDDVMVFNDRGSLSLTCTISDDVQPGVIAIPFGWWNDKASGGRGVNVLTNPEPPPDDAGSAAFHDTLVEVARPPVREP